MRRSPAIWTFVVVLAAGCAHRESFTADPQPTTPPAADVPRALRSPTEMMIALEDVRGLYLPKRPALVYVDDAAFTDACQRNERARAWRPEGEDWPASGAAAAVDAAIRTACVMTIAFYDRSGDRVVIKRDTFERLRGGKQVEVVAHEFAHAIQAHALPPPPT